MRKFPVQLDDRALQEFNDMLPWFAGMALPDGRVLGKVGTRDNKRDVLETVPDKRIVRLDAEVGLAGKSVLELGCFEGLHTLGLRMFSSDVTAVDIRAVNVLKTLARLSAFGTSANVFQFDVETVDAEFPNYDVIFHCGVLYHLEDPVAHLLRLLPHCQAMYLDTHVSPDGSGDVLVSDGKTYHGRKFVEGGWADPFSGRAAEAFWLRLEDIIALFASQGFSTRLWSERAERNGPRIGLLGVR